MAITQIKAAALLRLARAARRAFKAIARRHPGAGLYMQAAGIDVDGLTRELNR